MPPNFRGFSFSFFSLFVVFFPHHFPLNWACFGLTSQKVRKVLLNSLDALERKDIEPRLLHRDSFFARRKEFPFCFRLCRQYVFVNNRTSPPRSQHPCAPVFLQGCTQSWQTDCNLFQMTWAWCKLSAFSLVASCLLLLGAQAIWEIKLQSESELRKRSVISWGRRKSWRTLQPRSNYFSGPHSQLCFWQPKGKAAAG